MKQEGRILIIDDDEDILAAGTLLLKRHFSEVTPCDTPEQIPKLLSEGSFDAILLDMNFGPGESSGQQGFHWLEVIMSIDPQAVVIMITAHGGVKVAVEAMKRGATDYVAKPWENEKLVATLSAATQLGRTRSEASELKQRNKILAEVTSSSSGQLILGESQGMKRVQSLINRSAPTDARVLILGENGTGKELVARALHHRSQRSDQVFMSVDLGSISESLFESELFGHKKGAFTGANEDRVGRLQAASGGTLFLDEIGNLPLHLQAKLLTILEQREVIPLGSNKAVPIDVRIITATNLPLEKLKDERVFRQDLLFRRKPISDTARKAIAKYHWPGNIRALRHATERAVILSEGDELTAEDFQLSPAELSGQPESREPVIRELNLEKLEKQAIRVALKEHRYNISHAAKELGLTRAALYRRMEKHGL